MLIPDELIAKIPKKIEISKESCQEVVDTCIPIALHLAPEGTSTDAPEWPYVNRADCGLTFLREYLNGRPADPGPVMESWLKWFKRTCQAFNRAWENGQLGECERIAGNWQFYRDTAWDYPQQIARHIANADGETVFRGLRWPL